MPLALALVASALMHAAALIGSGWTLPGANEADAAPAIEAVLVKPAASPEATPAARPVPKPLVDKPRRLPVAAAAPVVAAAAAVSPPFAPGVAPAGTPPLVIPQPPVLEPVAAAPVPPLPKSALPGKGRVRYVITLGEGGLVVGQSVHTWEHDGLTYKLQSVTETTGLAALFKPARVVQSSRGKVTAEGLKPEEFRNERAGGTDSASFDWTRGVVVYAGREESVAPGAQDMLSMFYQLVLLAAGGGVPDISVATGRKLESYRFENLGIETVVLPAGERRALHLRTTSGKDTTDVWIAPDMRGLPLKVRFTDRKGDIFDQFAEDIDIQETQ